MEGETDLGGISTWADILGHKSCTQHCSRRTAVSPGISGNDWVVEVTHAERERERPKGRG